MKEKLIYIIKFIYYKLGFFPPQRIFSIEQIDKDYKYLPENIRRFLFQRYIYQIAYFNDQKSYIKILKFYFPNNHFSINNSQFINQLKDGEGESSLISFRKIKTKDNILFEKVYFSNHLDLQRNIIFYQYIYPLLKEKIQIPKLQKIIPGKWLSIVYFDFLNLQKIEKTGCLIQEMITLSLILYQSSIKYQKEILQLSLPSIIKDFTTHFEYQKKRKEAKIKLLEYNVSIEEIEKKINQSVHVFTHGDIFHTNIFQNKTLIDWDNFGIYPIGLDIAFIYYQLLSKNQLEESIENWLNENYKNQIHLSYWNDFIRNFFFFLFVFLIRGLNKEKYSQINSVLIENILKYNENNSWNSSI